MGIIYQKIPMITIDNHNTKVSVSREFQ